MFILSWRGALGLKGDLDEEVREAGVIVSQAVLIAIGIDRDGRRQVLAVELANRESRSSWRDFLLGRAVCMVSSLLRPSPAARSA
jgi:hypothetical protein